MKFRVNGKVKELVAIDAKTGLEWTGDMIGNAGALNYDEENDEYTMSEKDFEWWEKYTDLVNKVSELEQELTVEQRKEYEEESFAYADMIDETSARLEWLTDALPFSSRQIHAPDEAHESRTHD